MDGMVPDTSKTALMFFEEEESWTSKAASKVHSALLKYSAVFDKAGGAVSLGSIVFSLWSGAEQYDGSWAHAVIYAGDKQLDNVELICTALDVAVEYSPYFSTQKMFVAGVNPDYEKFSFSESFNALRESLAKSGHSGADGIDTCYRNGELLECAYHDAELFSILTYAFPFIESFNDTTETTGSLNYHAGVWDTNILPIGALFNKVYVVLDVNTDQRPIEEVRDIILTKGYNRWTPYALEFPITLNEGESVLNATLTTYTACGDGVETCGWIGDEKVIVY
jgi:hypothetical protein